MVVGYHHFRKHPIIAVMHHGVLKFQESRGVFFSSHLTSFVIPLFQHVSFGCKRIGDGEAFFGCKSRLRKSRSEDKLSFLRDAQLEGSGTSTPKKTVILRA